MYTITMKKVKKFSIFGLAEHIVDQLDLPPDEYMIKVGIDGEGGFLKVFMNILNSRKVQAKHKFFYSNDAFSQAFYDSGVKKLMTDDHGNC